MHAVQGLSKGSMSCIYVAEVQPVRQLIQRYSFFQKRFVRFFKKSVIDYFKLSVTKLNLVNVTATASTAL